MTPDLQTFAALIFLLLLAGLVMVFGVAFVAVLRLRRDLRARALRMMAAVPKDAEGDTQHMTMGPTHDLDRLERTFMAMTARVQEQATTLD